MKSYIEHIFATQKKKDDAKKNKRLRATLPQGDQVNHLSKSEFAIILKNPSKFAETHNAYTLHKVFGGNKKTDYLCYFENKDKEFSKRILEFEKKIEQELREDHI